MSQELASSYHARGKGLPATVGHVAPGRPIRARFENLKDGRSRRGGGGSRTRCVIVGGATIWREVDSLWCVFDFYTDTENNAHIIIIMERRRDQRRRVAAQNKEQS